MLSTFLKALDAMGPILAAAPEVQEIFTIAARVLGSDDQDELKALLAELRADRIAGHARLQAKLAEAAGR